MRKCVSSFDLKEERNESSLIRFGKSSSVDSLFDSSVARSLETTERPRSQSLCVLRHGKAHAV